MNRVVIVTGASGGIGRAIACAFASERAKLVFGYKSNLVKVEEVAHEAHLRGCDSIVLVQGDVSVAETADKLVKSALSLGEDLILINNAGITRDSLLMRMTEEAWDVVINTNLKSAFLCTRAALRPMIRQRFGRIVNVASVSGLIGTAGQANYAAAKAGLIALTMTTAREVASRHVTANAIAPGLIDTEMAQKLGDEMLAKYQEQIPLDRLGTPEEVADGVLFLANAAYITGHVLEINGGLHMG